MFYLFAVVISIQPVCHGGHPLDVEPLQVYINTAHRVFIDALEAVIACEADKIYLATDRLYCNNGITFLRTYNGKSIALPSVSTDATGTYISINAMVGSKFFKCVCKDCSHEWEPSVFDIWCPKCGSTNWRVARNR